MELTDRSGYFAGPGMLGGSFGDASRASDEAAEGVADPCPGHTPDQVVFYELTRKFVETEEDVPRRGLRRAVLHARRGPPHRRARLL